MPDALRAAFGPRVVTILDLLIWTAMGAVIGALLGAIQCSDSDSPPPRYGNVAHLVVCGFAGALVCSIVFVAFAYAIHESGPFSN